MWKIYVIKRPFLLFFCLFPFFIIKKSSIKTLICKYLTYSFVNLWWYESMLKIWISVFVQFRDIWYNALLSCLVVVVKWNAQAVNHITMRESYQCSTVYFPACKCFHICLEFLQYIMPSMSTSVYTLNIYFIIHLLYIR